MELSIGDKVVYPPHGVGFITGIEHLELVEGFERYYVIEIPDKHLTVRIPIRKIAESGVRPVMTSAKLSHVLEALRGKPHTLSEDYRTRQARIREKLETGVPLRIAEIVRDLTWHERRAHLTKVDSDLLARGREILSAEIAFVTGTEVTDVKHRIDEALTAPVADSPAM
jgi:CarD family transcriptional regulator